jgi:hypothetical protein
MCRGRCNVWWRYGLNSSSFVFAPRDEIRWSSVARTSLVPGDAGSMHAWRTPKAMFFCCCRRKHPRPCGYRVPFVQSRASFSAHGPLRSYFSWLPSYGRAVHHLSPGLVPPPNRPAQYICFFFSFLYFLCFLWFNFFPMFTSKKNVA